MRHRYRQLMSAVSLRLPAEVALDLAGLAAADRKSVSEEAVMLLRRAIAARQLREVLSTTGSDVDADAAMQIALAEEQAARRGR